MPLPASGISTTLNPSHLCSLKRVALCKRIDNRQSVSINNRLRLSKRTWVFIVSIFLPVLLTGCLGSSSDGAKVSTPDNYVYKGKPDPLLNTSGSDRASALNDRFMQVQGRE